jgi:hypothetical protein
MKDVIIIGAGLSGLVCAQRLRQAGVNVRIVEKAAGPGGRMATQHIQGIWVDRGTQYITVRNDAFERFICKLEDKGIVREWTRAIYRLTPDGLLAPDADDMYPRYCSPHGMTAIARYLAEDQDITFNQRIVGVEVKGDRWHLQGEDGETFTAGAVVATMPAPQFIPLFGAVMSVVPTFIRTLKMVKFAPSIIVMAGYSSQQEIPPEWQAIVCVDDPMLSWIGLDSSKHPQEPSQPVFVFQSTGEFARLSLEEDNLEIAGKPLLEQVGDYLAPWLSEPEWWQVHRWRYAFVQEPLGVACLSAETPLPIICAGDWCAGDNLEGAYQSGGDAAKSLLEML